jgi:hypothetical protein
MKKHHRHDPSTRVIDTSTPATAGSTPHSIEIDLIVVIC